MKHLPIAVSAAAFLLLLAGCTPAGFALNFSNQKKVVLLQGAQIGPLCTPTFANREEAEIAWRELHFDSAAFQEQYCPTIPDASDNGVRYFSYFTDTGTFQEWNPGGYEEMGLYTGADLDQMERGLTRQPYDEHGMTFWSSCEKRQRALTDTLIAQALTCTRYHSDYPDGDRTKPRETYSLLPNTDCFVSLGNDLYFGFRIPVSALDSGSDGCQQLKEWGISSIQLQ